MVKPPKNSLVFLHFIYLKSFSGHTKIIMVPSCTCIRVNLSRLTNVLVPAGHFPLLYSYLTSDLSCADSCRKLTLCLPHPPFLSSISFSHQSAVVCLLCHACLTRAGYSCSGRMWSCKRLTLHVYYSSSVGLSHSTDSINRLLNHVLASVLYSEEGTLIVSDVHHTCCEQWPFPIFLHWFSSVSGLSYYLK